MRSAAISKSCTASTYRPISSQACFDLDTGITDAVLEAVAEWQGGPLDACYPRRLLSARLLRRDPGEDQGRRVRAQQACPEPVEGAVYIAPGILPDGTKDILGIGIEQTEGETFWLRVINELDNRGVADILIAVVDGLKGFPEAINAVFPETVVQTCSRPAPDLHRPPDHKLDEPCFVARTASPSPRRRAASIAPRVRKAGLAALDDFEEGSRGQKYPAITQSWAGTGQALGRHWAQVIPFFAFSAPIRRMIYTTNAIEALNSKIGRAVRTRGHFPGDEAAMTLPYLVLDHAAAQWIRPPREWCKANTPFAIIFSDRVMV